MDICKFDILSVKGLHTRVHTKVRWTLLFKKLYTFAIIYMYIIHAASKCMFITKQKAAGCIFHEPMNRLLTTYSSHYINLINLIYMYALHKDLLCLNGQIWLITDQVSCVAFQINHYNEGRDQIPSIRFPVLLYAEMKFEITENSLQLEWSVRQNMVNLKAFSLEKKTLLIKILETATWMK